MSELSQLSQLSQLAFVTRSLHHISEKEETLDLQEQQGLLEILENIQMEMQRGHTT